jgi:hypothetical protein
MANNEVTVHQLLHGYDNGHSLISASIQLNPELRRVLLIMSDMSGPSMVKGFEEYITGYPLKEASLYCLAKTWYAPEMKRPGCVWTHTILIGFADLAKLSDPVDLLRLFRRPDRDSRPHFYGSPINISYSTSLTSGISTLDLSAMFLRKIISALYSEPSKCVFIKAFDSKQFENLILSIWFQQWPRLRRNFSFCTGAIAPRSIDSVPIDLQVVPVRSAEQMRHGTSIDWLDPEVAYSVNEEDWIDETVQDLNHPSTLRNFLRTFGADIHDEKRAYKLLVEMYCKLKYHRNLNNADVISYLADSFPYMGNASHLKISLLGRQVPSPNFWAAEHELLFLLATTEQFESFNYEKLQFLERFEEYFARDVKEALHLVNQLIEGEINPFGQAAIRASARIVDAGHLVQLEGKVRRSLTLVFVLLNPVLAYDKRLWQELAMHREIVNSLLNSEARPEIEWQQIITILIETNSSIDLDVFERRGIDLTAYILGFITNSSKPLSNSWLSYLRNRSKEILLWLNKDNKINDEVILLVASLLNPNSRDVVNNGSRVWVKILSENKIKGRNTNLVLNSFALALAFNKPDKQSLELISYTFQAVYLALMEDQLDDRLWSRIEIHTKSLNFWNDWDKCKKLVHALIDKFPEIKWTKQQAQQVATDSALIDRIVERYRKVH